MLSVLYDTMNKSYGEPAFKISYPSGLTTETHPSLSRAPCGLDGEDTAINRRPFLTVATPFSVTRLSHLSPSRALQPLPISKDPQKAPRLPGNGNAEFFSTK